MSESNKYGGKLTLEKTLEQAESWRRMYKEAKHWEQTAPYVAEMALMLDEIERLQAMEERAKEQSVDTDVSWNPKSALRQAVAIYIRTGEYKEIQQ